MFTYIQTPALLVFPAVSPLRTLLSQLCVKLSSLHKVVSRTNFQVFMDFMINMKEAAKPNIFQYKQRRRHKRSGDNYVLCFHIQCRNHGAVNN